MGAALGIIFNPLKAHRKPTKDRQDIGVGICTEKEK